jgi:hypothetical protein
MNNYRSADPVTYGTGTGKPGYVYRYNTAQAFFSLKLEMPSMKMTFNYNTV